LAECTQLPQAPTAAMAFWEWRGIWRPCDHTSKSDWQKSN